MLPRKKLVPLKSEFGRIRATGRMYDSPSFGIIAAFSGKRIADSEARMAFIVSKKIDKRSVVRHVIKRKLSDAVSPFLARLPKNLELVFLAKKKAVNSTKEEISEEIKNIFQRARFL